MIASPLFRRHYFISVAVIIAGLLVSFFAAHLIATYERERDRKRERDRFPTHPSKYFSSIVPLMTGKSPEEAIRLLNPENPKDLPFRFTHLTVESDDIKKMSPDERKALDAGELVEKSSVDGAMPEGYVSLGENRGYLKTSFSRPTGIPGPPPPPGAGPPGPRGPFLLPPFFLLTLACLFVGMILTTGVAIFLLFSSYKKRAEIASGVLQELKSGNLSARLPTQKMDELSHLVSLFNKMADEIENLVNRIKSSEANRTQALQKLAHDLRTPLASMKSLLETLTEDRLRMSEDQIQRSIALCLAEETYFERLVEDLLVLASLSGPIGKGSDRLSLKELLRDAVEATQARFPTLSIQLEADSDGVMRGDRRMVERMLRNGLENAAAFASKNIRLSLSTIGGPVVTIVDDGPGLSDEDLKNFGSARATRRVNLTHGMRVSSGLGSLIMKEVAQLHGGTAVIRNRIDNGKIIGAELKLSLSAV